MEYLRHKLFHVTPLLDARTLFAYFLLQNCHLKPLRNRNVDMAAPKSTEGQHAKTELSRLSRDALAMLDKLSSQPDGFNPAFAPHAKAVVMLWGTKSGKPTRRDNRPLMAQHENINCFGNQRKHARHQINHAFPVIVMM